MHVWATNAGPKSVELAADGTVLVTLTDGLGELVVTYDDLDAIAGTAVLFVDAWEKLNAALIAEYGARVPAGVVEVGDQIVVDDRVVAVNAISVVRDGGIELHWLDPISGKTHHGTWGHEHKLTRIEGADE